MTERINEAAVQIVEMLRRRFDKDYESLQESPWAGENLMMTGSNIVTHDDGTMTLVQVFFKIESRPYTRDGVGGGDVGPAA